MDVVEVVDPDDPRLADFRNLSDADTRPDRRGIVIAEGVNVVERLLGSPYPVRAVFGVRSRVEALAPALTAVDAPAFVADKWLLSAVVGFRVTRGLLASAGRVPAVDAATFLARARRLAVLEGLNDFENLGALFRSAAAFGVDGVLLDPTCADPLYRRSVRVSMGHALQVPFAQLPGTWPEGLRTLRAAGFAVLAMTPAADAADLRTLEPPPRWAVLLGAEGPGLSAATLAAADIRVRIPMAPGVDSLNVATAGAIAFAFLTRPG